MPQSLLAMNWGSNDGGQSRYDELTAYVWVQMNLVHLIAWVIGIMGLPALLLFPLFLWKRHQSQKALANGALHAPGLLPSWHGQVRPFLSLPCPCPCLHCPLHARPWA